jgi:hypothetical protein
VARLFAPGSHRFCSGSLLPRLVSDVLARVFSRRLSWSRSAGPHPWSRVPLIPLLDRRLVVVPSAPHTLNHGASAADADCGFDPARDACVADPRANRHNLAVDLHGRRALQHVASAGAGR